MPEINQDTKIKTIAFYLPQYHAIPENDWAWGVGFTEWTNVKKAKPLFEGHYQPRVPLENNYYNLLDERVLVEQSKTAQKYGIFGFCYYHYWFKNGKKLLEKPIEKMLQSKDVTIPYCLCWANENWTKKWDGSDNEVIVLQDYGGQNEWEKHFQYLLSYFRDKRYITINGKPVFLIYRPNIIPCIQKMLKFFERRALEVGLKGICFVVQNGSAYFDPEFIMGKFSYQIKFEPFFSYGLSGRQNWKQRKFISVLKFLRINKIVYKCYEKMNAAKPNRGGYAPIRENQIIFDYDNIWQNILKKNVDKYLLEGGFIDWDNTARTPFGARTEGATPEKFGMYMSKLIAKIHKEKELPVIFINAWNEWGEGAYLEPDEKYGYAYLEALSAVLSNNL